MRYGLLKIGVSRVDDAGSSADDRHRDAVETRKASDFVRRGDGAVVIGLIADEQSHRLGRHRIVTSTDGGVQTNETVKVDFEFGHKEFLRASWCSSTAFGRWWVCHPAPAAS